MTPLSRQGSASSPLVWQGLMIACAIALGSFRLTHKDLWVDEAASAGFALGGPSAWIADHNMALYYTLLSAWVRVFGISEMSLRAPSVLCFALSVPLVYQVARVSFGDQSARIASLLHVSNAFMVQFSQEARGYMLVVVLVLCAQLALLRSIERPALRWSVIYGVCAGLAPYAHLFAIFSVLAHLFVPPAAARRGCITAFGIAAIVSAPLFVQIASTGADQVSWIRPLTLRALLEVPVIWTGGGSLLAILICGLFARGAPALRSCVAGVLVPLAAAVVVSLCVAPMLLPKYLIGAVPSLQLGAAAALARWPRRCALAICALLVVLSAVRLHDWYFVQQKERWREAVTYLQQHVQPGEPLILDLPSPEPFDYYVTRQPQDMRLRAPRWPVRDWAFPTPDEKPVTRAEVLAQLSRELPERIWLIHNRSPLAPELGPLAQHYRVSSEERLEARGDTADARFGAQGALLITVRSLTRIDGPNGR